MAGSWKNNYFVLEGRRAAEAGAMTAMWRYVSAGYLRTAETPTLKGRALVEADRRDVDKVVVISKAMAAR